jgi:hypothetical protein
MRLIVWELPDESIVLEWPSYNDILRPSDDTEEALLHRCVRKTRQRLAEQHGPAIYHIIEDAEVPAYETVESLRWRSGRLIVNSE